MRRSISSNLPAALAALGLFAIVDGVRPGVRAEDYIDDDAVKTAFENQLGELYRAGGLPAATAIARQLRSATRAPLAPPPGEPSPAPPGPGGAIARARAATLVLGHLYLCGKCDKYHANVAGGVLISPDGLAVTNHHVLDARNALVFGAMTADGRLFAIERILAASKSDDLALVRLRGAADLPHAPLQSEISSGDEVFVLSHPDGHFYTLTRGYVARKYLSARERSPRLQITADFAKGSSGSGIFNARGGLVGLAASTNSIYHEVKDGKPVDLQMVVKTGIPAESILPLFGGEP